MKVDVKKVDALRRELSFEVPRERVTDAMDQVYKEIGKYAKVKGFRPGKVPRNLLVSSHGKIAQEETIKKLVPQAYHEGVTQEKLNPIDMPEISQVAIKEGVLTFIATLDIRPEVKTGEYKGISVQPLSTQVSEEEINKTLLINYYQTEIIKGYSLIQSDFIKNETLDFFLDNTMNAPYLAMSNVISSEFNIIKSLIICCNQNFLQKLEKNLRQMRFQRTLNF